MLSGGQFRSIMELCQYDMGEADRALCESTAERYRGQLMGYCFDVQQTNPTDEFCMTALPAPSSRFRTENMLGERARTGRLPVVAQLPVDFDDLPEALQDAFDEDTYTALMNDEPLSSLEETAGIAPWRISLRFQYDLSGTYNEITVNGVEGYYTEDIPPTKYLARFGGRFEVAYRFDFSLTILGGVDYMIDYADNGGDLNMIDGVLGGGLSFEVGEGSFLELVLLGKLGYLFSSGQVSHAAFGGPFEVSNLDGGIGFRMDYVARISELWNFIIGLEGQRTFTAAERDGLEVLVFPYYFLFTMGAGIG